MADELVDVVDEDCNVLGQVMKSVAHEQGFLHKTVIGYLRRGDEWRLVRQSGHKQDPGQLVGPVGGHVAAGEPDDIALLRESGEEIGTLNIMYKEIGRFRFHRQIIGRDENHLFVVYEIDTKDQLVFNDEIESIETFTSSELKELILQKPNEFGDAFYVVLEQLYPEYLPVNYKYRWAKK